MIVYLGLVFSALSIGVERDYELGLEIPSLESEILMNADVLGAIKWRTETGHTLLVAPAVTAEVMVAVGIEQSSRSRVGFLEAFAWDTGRPRWSLRGDSGMGVKGGILATPAVANDFVCFGSGLGTLHCLDMNSGATRWQGRAGGPVVTAPVVGTDQIFFTSEDGSLTALDLHTGRQRWTFRTTNAIRAAPVIQGAHVILGSWDGHLYALTTDGVLEWKVDLSPARPTAITASQNQVIFFDSATGRLRTVSTTHGAAGWHIEERWSFPTGYRSRIQPVLAESLVCLSRENENLVTCLDAATGTLRWTAPIGKSPLTPIARDKQLIVVSRDGQISVFDLESGVECWRIETEIPLTSEPALGREMLYVGGQDTAVYAFSLQPDGQKEDCDAN